MPEVLFNVKFVKKLVLLLPASAPYIWPTVPFAPPRGFFSDRSETFSPIGDAKANRHAPAVRATYGSCCPYRHFGSIVFSCNRIVRLGRSGANSPRISPGYRNTPTGHGGDDFSCYLVLLSFQVGPRRGGICVGLWPLRSCLDRGLHLLAALTGRQDRLRLAAGCEVLIGAGIRSQSARQGRETAYRRRGYYITQLTVYNTNQNRKETKISGAGQIASITPDAPTCAAAANRDRTCRNR